MSNDVRFHNDPVLGKRPPDKRDHRPLTWPVFLKIREWAQTVAAAQQCALYLVGSVLDHDCPRDVDVALVLPREAFEARFGPIPPRGGEPAMSELLMAMQRSKGPIFVDAQVAVDFAVYVDVHVAPDTWWHGRPRLLLATADVGPLYWDEET